MVLRISTESPDIDKQDRYRSGVAKLVLGITVLESLVYLVFLNFFLILFCFILFYFILSYFLVVFLPNYSIIYLSSILIINCGIHTNRKWNYEHVSVLPLIGTSVRRSSSRRSGGRLLAMTQWPLKMPLFSFFFHFIFHFIFSALPSSFPPLLPFLIEGVLGSKNLFFER